MNRTRFTAVIFANVLVAACSSKPPVEPALAASGASLEAARAAGADDLAAVELQQARNKLERARAFAQAGDARSAIRLAEQADADAQLARAQAASERSRRSVDEVQANLRALREELNRAGTSPVQAPGALPR